MSKGFLKSLAVAGGAPAAMRSLKGSRLRILMYHRFHGDPDVIEEQVTRQLRHLRRHYQPVSMTEAIEAILNGKPVASRAVAITVDDGYADFRRALPLFQSFELPVTLFVVPGFIDRALWLWPDVIFYCLRNSPLGSLALGFPDGTRFERPLTTPAEQDAADEALDRILVTTPDQFRRQVIADLPRQTAVELPERIPEEFAPLGWNELRDMSRSGLDVGAHTRTHPLLSRIADPQAVRDEIGGSKLDIERALGLPVRHFCYPNGTAADYNEDCCRAVQEAGFLSAVTTRRGMNAPGAKRFELARIGLDPDTPFETFQLEVAGYRMA